MSTAPDLLVVNAKVYTCDKTHPSATAFTTKDGLFVSVFETDQEGRAAVDGSTKVVDLAGAFVMPGMIDGHIHLGPGGNGIAFELPLEPTDDVETIVGKVEEWAKDLRTGDWITGGIVGSTTMDNITAEDLEALDAASAGHPVLLRDDTLHNRWINTAALRAMGVNEDTPDPERGHYVRDSNQALTGVMHETASNQAEMCFAASIKDPAERSKGGILASIKLINSLGITAVQDANTSGASMAALSSLEGSGELLAWVVASMQGSEAISEHEYGPTLYDTRDLYRSKHVLPNFAKLFLDGVPMTRTSALLHPYKCFHPDHTEGFLGEAYLSKAELVSEIRHCMVRGLGVKMHATGDASTRLILDAVEVIRAEFGSEPLLQIAHTEYIAPEDIPRFAELKVIADASPHLWFPGVIQESIEKHVPDIIFRGTFPNKTLLDHGALLSAGSDWPCVAPTPSPWMGLETIITRQNPDPSIEGSLCPTEALTRSQAIEAFTVGPAQAMGLGDKIGKIKAGFSADFIVLDRNLIEVDVREIHNVQVKQTWFEGKIVYESSQR